MVAYVQANSSDIKDNSEETLTLFLKKNSTYVDTTDNEEVDLWSVIMDGEVKEIKVKDGVGSKFTVGGMYYSLEVDKDGYYESGRDFGNVDTGAIGKNAFSVGKLNGELTVDGNSLKMGTVALGTVNNYLITSDTEIVVVMRPTGVGTGDLKGDLMVDSAASWETKTVNGKQLNNMFGSYLNVYGTYYMVKTASDSNVVDTLYLDINGVGAKK